MAITIFFRIVIRIFDLTSYLDEDGNFTPKLFRKIYGMIQSDCPHMGKMKMNMKSDDMFAFLLPFILEWILDLIKVPYGPLNFVFASEFMKINGITEYPIVAGMLNIPTYDQIKQIFEKLNIRSSFDDLYFPYIGLDPDNASFDDILFLNGEIMPYLNYWIVHEVIFVEYYKYDFSKFKFSEDDKIRMQSVLMSMGLYVAEKRIQAMN